jgi:DNA-binding GntR family transcriptional regulator
VHNVGYAVTRLNQEEFGQIYTMRHLLETEVIRDLPRPTQERLSGIIAAGDAVAQAGERPDLAEMRARNQDFHFAIFRLSPRGLIVDEIERLWNLAAPYHAMYLYSPDGRRTVLTEHAAMIDALSAGDNARLAALMDDHRHGSQTHLFG